MYKRNILDYFHFHEPTNVKKNKKSKKISTILILKELKLGPLFHFRRRQLIQGWNKTLRLTTLVIVIATVT